MGVLDIKLFAAGRWRTAVIALLLHGLPKGYIAGCVKSLLERTHYGISSMIIIIKGQENGSDVIHCCTHDLIT